MFLDPIVFSIGPISIYWYSLAYVLGIFFSYWYLSKLDKKQVLNRDFYDSFIIFAIVGVVLGGRLGYVLIYNPAFYMSNPSEIFKTWNGGMSFHGGVLGSLFMIIISCKRNNIPVFYVLDLISCSVPIGLFLGRIGNFINGELFGRVTNVSWGIVFEESGDSLLRHPSQLYEAFFEGFLLFVVINLLFFFTKVNLFTGVLTSIAVMWYGIVRFVIEFFREPDNQIGYLWFDLTMGQILSLFMIFIGAIVFLIRSNLRYII